jgi:GNAT superfamily N-acetyltransferase
MSWRTAGPADAAVLRDLEREANLVGLAHVFPAEEFPFPDGGVLARWEATLANPGVTVEVYADPDPVVLLAYDLAGRLRHLAVAPERWGTGLGRAGVDRAVVAMTAAGLVPTLWVLTGNHRARSLYEHLGWEPTGREQAAEWPPYPTELEMRLPESRHGR